MVMIGVLGVPNGCAVVPEYDFAGLVALILQMSIFVKNLFFESRFDIAEHFVSNDEHCAWMCMNNPECHYFTLTIWGVCYLKSIEAGSAGVSVRYEMY